MPYRTIPGEGFACFFLQWHNLKDAIAVYACDAGRQERSGGMLKIGHLGLRIQLYLTDYVSC